MFRLGWSQAVKQSSPMRQPLLKDNPLLVTWNAPGKHLPLLINHYLLAFSVIPCRGILKGVLNIIKKIDTPGLSHLPPTVVWNVICLFAYLPSSLSPSERPDYMYIHGMLYYMYYSKTHLLVSLVQLHMFRLPVSPSAFVWRFPAKIQ